jgi:hypothetical protein
MDAQGAANRSARIVVGCAVTLLAACVGADDDVPLPAPLVIEPGPAAPPAVDLDIELTESEFFVYSEWPQACDLLTEDDITAVLPQVVSIESTRYEQEFRILGTEFTRTVPGAGCSYQLDIPDAGLSIDDVPPPIVNVSVDAAGSPDAVQLNFTPGDEQIEVPSGECYAWGGPTLVCAKGAVAFTISVTFSHQHVDADSWTDRYQVGEETTTFSDEVGNIGEPDANEVYLEGRTFLRDTLGVELTKVVLAKT